MFSRVCIRDTKGVGGTEGFNRLGLLPLGCSGSVLISHKNAQIKSTYAILSLMLFGASCFAAPTLKETRVRNIRSSRNDSRLLNAGLADMPAFKLALAEDTHGLNQLVSARPGLLTNW